MSTSVLNDQQESVKDILLQSIVTIQENNNCTWEEAEELKRDAARQLLPNNPLTALQLLDEGNFEEKLSLGCPHLDSNVKGGLLLNGITEIAGDPGSGKTQLCLQMALTAQWPKEYGGLKTGVAYICTEGPFPSLRFRQMIEGLQQRFPASDPRFHLSYANNVFVEKIGDVTSLLDCLYNRLPILLTSGRARCVMIDSVAALFRSEYETHEGLERAQAIQSMGLQLRKLHYRFNAAILCVNQVTEALNDVGSDTVAALGLAWSNLVTSRFLLSRTQYVVDKMPNQEQFDQRVRQMRVVFSPYLPKSHWYYLVTQDGVRGVEPEELTVTVKPD